MKLAGRSAKAFNGYSDRFEGALDNYTAERRGDWENAILHLHSWSAASDIYFRRCPSSFGYFANFRDPRDVTISMRKLQDLPLEKAVAFYGNYHAKFRHFCSTTQPMRLRYETITLSPHQLADQIAARLNVTLTLSQIDEIVAATSKEKHSEFMKSLASKDSTSVEVQTPFRLMREDSKTHISDHHIQSGETGRWRTETTAEELALMKEKLEGYIKALGYALSSE